MAKYKTKLGNPEVKSLVENLLTDGIKDYLNKAKKDVMRFSSKWQNSLRSSISALLCATARAIALNYKKLVKFRFSARRYATAI